MTSALSADDRILVSLDHICQVLAAWTGIPPERLLPGRLDPAAFEQLQRQLAERIFGQARAIEAGVSALERRFRLGAEPESGRPVWNALFAGPSGVGKTQLARELAVSFFGSPRALIQIDCSEFDQEHHLARLVGAPPGYVGHGQGGQLTNELRRCSNGVVLLDEVEKAHPRILTAVVLPLLGEGVVHDMNTGQALHAGNMIVVLTSNLRTNRPAAAAFGFQAAGADPRQNQEKSIRSAIEEHFPREVLGRIDDTIIFEPLSEEAIKRIWLREVAGLEQRLSAQGQPVQVRIDSAAETLLFGHIQGLVGSQGARAVLRFFEKAVVDRCLNLLRGWTFGACRVVIEPTEEGGLRYRVVESSGG
jgi:ATP-dependent Clp protease ATP-binding subunit ClpA